MAIAATDAGIDLFAAADPASDQRAQSHAEGVMQDRGKLFAGDEGIVLGGGSQRSRLASKFIQAIAQHRHWSRELKGQMPA